MRRDTQDTRSRNQHKDAFILSGLHKIACFPCQGSVNTHPIRSPNPRTSENTPYFSRVRGLELLMGCVLTEPYFMICRLRMKASLCSLRTVPLLLFQKKILQKNLSLSRCNQFHFGHWRPFPRCELTHRENGWPSPWLDFTLGKSIFLRSRTTLRIIGLPPVGRPGPSLRVSSCNVPESS